MSRNSKKKIWIQYYLSYFHSSCYATLRLFIYKHIYIYTYIYIYRESRNNQSCGDLHNSIFYIPLRDFIILQGQDQCDAVGRGHETFKVHPQNHKTQRTSASIIKQMEEWGTRWFLKKIKCFASILSKNWFSDLSAPIIQDFNAKNWKSLYRNLWKNYY